MVRIFTVSALLMTSVAAWAPPALADAAAPEVIESFVASFATPTRMTGKIARWENGICPLAVGQQPAIVKYVTQRVKDAATMVGAPVHADPSCTPNVEIIFTRLPQELLDNIRARHTDYLGYAESAAATRTLATVTRPLQAWYETQTIDRKGIGRIDSARRPGEGVPLPCFTCIGRSSGQTEYLTGATYAGVTGNRVNDGLRSTFYHITIVADVNKLKGYETGPLADYIAMLALAQLNSLDVCQPLPSIENMMAKGCEAKSGALTQSDIAYLRGLYKMNPDRILLTSQRGEITDSMKAALAGR